MTRLRFLASWVVAGAALVVAASAAPAQDGAAPDTAPEAVPSREERIRRLRELTPQEKQRLEEALVRFRALPPERREELRHKARAVGVDRLGELAGREFAPLRRRHVALHRELDAILELLGRDRVESLPPQQAAYVRAEAIRGFQRHVRRQLISLMGAQATGGNFDLLDPALRRQRMDESVRKVQDQMLAELPPEERARIAALPPEEQRRERGRLMGEYRMQEAVTFARMFERFRLVPFLSLPEAERAEVVARWAERGRWFEMAGRLRAAGVSKQALELLAQLRADEWARVQFEADEAARLPPEQRVARIEQSIRELHGRGAMDDDRHRRPLLRLREMQRRRRLGETPGAPESPR